MQTGTVKWFDAVKGFGFVIPLDGGADIYLHQKAVQKAGIATLEPGTAINFSVASRGGKSFVEEISIIAAADPTPVQSRRSKNEALGATDSEQDDFEREWGLRRV